MKRTLNYLAISALFVATAESTVLSLRSAEFELWVAQLESEQMKVVARENAERILFPDRRLALAAAQFFYALGGSAPLEEAMRVSPDDELKVRILPYLIELHGVETRRTVEFLVDQLKRARPRVFGGESFTARLAYRRSLVDALLQLTDRPAGSATIDVLSEAELDTVIADAERWLEEGME